MYLWVVGHWSRSAKQFRHSWSTAWNGKLFNGSPTELHLASDKWMTKNQLIIGNFLCSTLRKKKRKKRKFYLTTHFIYGYIASDIIMVKDHSDSQRGNPLHGLLFPICSKGSLSHRQDSTYHSLCRGAQAGTRNSSMGPQ